MTKLAKLSDCTYSKFWKFLNNLIMTFFSKKIYKKDRPHLKIEFFIKPKLSLRCCGCPMRCERGSRPPRRHFSNTAEKHRTETIFSRGRRRRSFYERTSECVCLSSRERKLRGKYNNKLSTSINDECQCQFNFLFLHILTKFNNKS